MYFHDAGEPPRPPPQFTLHELPFDEYWTGLVFNGNKIGFTHLAISPVPDAGDLYELRARAILNFHFLGIEKKVSLQSIDRVNADLTVERTRGDYNLDGNRLKVTGNMTGEGFRVAIESRGEVHHEVHPVQGPLYPSSVIALYPVLHGLEVGRRYVYDVYDGETQSVATVTQEIVGFEASDLFEGHAFKIRTRLHGQEVTTWLGTTGLPLLEMSMGGVFIAGLESEEMARRYLTRAALNKQESVLEFSRVRAVPAVTKPRSVGAMTVELGGLGEFVVPSDERQRCRQRESVARCEILSARRPAASLVDETGEQQRYLRSTVTVPSAHAAIRELARRIAGPRMDRQEQIVSLVDWIRDNVENVAVDSFSALDVLATRKAECQGNTYLYAALARSLEIPTRVVNGLVSSESYGGGFFYPTWAESRVRDGWISVDPTFGQANADATHIKLLEGESLDQLAPLVGLMGKLNATVVAAEHGK